MEILRFICLLTIIREYTIVAEYAIVTNGGYLYSTFSDINVTEDIFPSDIMINISFSKILGLLLYSYDTHGNQFIVTLEEIGIQRTLNLCIALNSKRKCESMFELCGCSCCLYEALNIRIQIQTKSRFQCNMTQIQKKIRVQCNNRRIIERDYNKTGSTINKYYHIPENRSVTHLWLVNDNHFPLDDQMEGCIFDVTYKKDKIIFGNVTDGIKSGCTRLCTNNTCNGGECYETYLGQFICNCTSTFNNGIMCNDNIKPINSIIPLKNITIKMFKLSWNSTRAQMTMISRNLNLSLCAKDNEFYLKYKYKTLEVNLHSWPDTYRTSTDTILVATFHLTFVAIKYFNNGSWHQMKLPTEYDLRLEQFNNLELSSGNGIMDFVYSNSIRCYAWTSVKNYSAGGQLREQADTSAYISCSDPKPKFEKDVSNWCLAILITLIVLVITNIVYLAFVYCPRKKQYLAVALKMEQIGLHECETEEQKIQSQ